MSSASATRLVLLPGLGADVRQFDPQRAALPGLEVPAWLPHWPDESLSDYGRRMAATITPSAGFCLGGSSFGGMVAQEMVRHLQPAPRAVFLIASCRSGAALAPHLRYFVDFAGLFPERTFEAGQGATPLFVSKFGHLLPSQRMFFEEMLVAAQPAFVRWGIRAITEWLGAGELPMPVYHIHGSDDELIPCENVHADCVIPGGGHLINVTHAGDVNAFVAERLEAQRSGA